MLESAIDLKGVGNARQLGGYRIGDRRIREGVLLRTAALTRIAPGAIEALQNQYHLQTIVDLRMSFECDMHPDPAIPGAQYLHLPVMELEDTLTAASGDVDPQLMAMFTNPGTMSSTSASCSASGGGPPIAPSFRRCWRWRRDVRSSGTAPTARTAPAARPC